MTGLPARPRPRCRVLVTGLFLVAAAGRLDAQAAAVRAPVSVRGAGLNGTGAALVGHAGALFSNPASLATIRHISLEGGYVERSPAGWIATGALAWRLRQFHLGGGGLYQRLGPAPAAGAAHPHEWLGAGSLVYRFGLMAIGGSVKMARRSAGGQVDEGVSGDLGITIAVFDILALAFARQNVGGNWNDRGTLAMPGLSRFGFAMNYVDPQETFRLMSTLEVQWPEGSRSRWILGGEAGIVVKGVGLIGRGAWASRPAGTGSPVTIGGTVNLSQLMLDYAFDPRAPAGDARHRFGVRFVL